MAKPQEIGRNSPCPCGSGRKYKRCCGGNSAPRQSAAPDPQPLVEMAWSRFQAGQQGIAEQLCQQILKSHPDHPDALHFLGLIAHQRGQPENALGLLKRAAARAPRNPGIHCSLGNLLRHQGQLQASAEALGQAVKLDPRLAAAQLNLGITLKEQGHYRQAAESYRRALELQPGLAVAHYDLGICLAEMGETGDAERHYRQASRLDPQFAESRYNLALQQLREGNFAEGWQNYEWRWRCEEFAEAVRDFSQPLWDGSALAGRTLLLHAEQGYGDTLQFVRYLPRVLELGGAVILECQPPLKGLLQTSFPEAQVVARGESLPTFDCHCPLLSLPRIFATDLGGIPAPVPYLKTDPARPCPLEKALEAAGNQLRVGLVWAGSPTHKQDRRRSTDLHQWQPVLQRAGVCWVSLQLGPARTQLAELELPILDAAEALEDFHSTARLVQSLDLVISVDSAVAHLAGALNVPVWTLVYHPPEWRWLEGREDSPWYPSMRLFRQRDGETWERVLERIASALDTFSLSQRTRPLQPRPTTPAEQRLTLPGFNELRGCRYGPMLYNRHDRYVGRSLKNYGEFSEQECQLLQQLLQPGAWAVEVGANIGALTVPLAKRLGPEGRLYAFEPQRLLHQTLCANLALNGLTNVDARQVAVGRHPGEVQIPPVNPYQGFNFGGVSMGEPSAEEAGERVPLVALDQLDLHACHLIKVDVEGMELEVLQGAVQTLARHRPLLYVENDREAHSAELIAWILGHGYRAWWHLPLLFNPDNWAGNPENLFGAIRSINLLCTPPGVEPPIALRPVAGPEDRWDAGGQSGENQVS